MAIDPVARRLKLQDAAQRFIAQEIDPDEYSRLIDEANNDPPGDRTEERKRLDIAWNLFQSGELDPPAYGLVVREIRGIKGSRRISREQERQALRALLRISGKSAPPDDPACLA